MLPGYKLELALNLLPCPPGGIKGPSLVCGTCFLDHCKYPIGSEVIRYLSVRKRFGKVTTVFRRISFIIMQQKDCSDVYPKTPMADRIRASDLSESMLTTERNPNIGATYGARSAPIKWISHGTEIKRYWRRQTFLSLLHCHNNSIICIHDSFP